jgi:hypothetical protein
MVDPQSLTKPLRLTVVSADAQLLTACHSAGLHIVNPEDD